jgi:hypothetical protein
MVALSPFLLSQNVVNFGLIHSFLGISPASGDWAGRLGAEWLRFVIRVQAGPVAGLSGQRRLQQLS